MSIQQAIKAIDPRVNFEEGNCLLEVEFYDDYDKKNIIYVYIKKSFKDRLIGRGTKSYKAFAKQYGDMFILVIKKDTHNESYTVINNTVVDHETFNPNHFIEFRHYHVLKQDHFRTI